MPVLLREILADMYPDIVCHRCANNTHICTVCHASTSHGNTICPDCDNQLEQEAA